MHLLLFPIQMGHLKEFDESLIRQMEASILAEGRIFERFSQLSQQIINIFKSLYLFNEAFPDISLYELYSSV